jgi:hypothetical protein
MRGLACALVVVSLSLHAFGDDQAEARALFERGKQAMSAGRFAEAREQFQRSLELVPKASAAFNLAVALRGMGRPKQSHELLERMLRGEFGELPADRREEVALLAAEARRDIATLTVVARGADSIELRLDGVRAGTLVPDRPLTLEVNPGERVLAFGARLRDPLERRVTLGPGKSAKVSATLRLSQAARRSTLLLVAKDATHDVEIEGVGRSRGRIQRKLDPGRYVVRLHSPNGTRESSVLLEPATAHRVELEPPAPGISSSPWFWAAAGAVVVGAAVGGYFLLRDREREPVRDPEFGVVQTLRWR